MRTGTGRDNVSCLELVRGTNDTYTGTVHGGFSGAAEQGMAVIYNGNGGKKSKCIVTQGLTRGRCGIGIMLASHRPPIKSTNRVLSQVHNASVNVCLCSSSARLYRRLVIKTSVAISTIFKAKFGKTTSRGGTHVFGTVSGDLKCAMDVSVPDNVRTSSKCMGNTTIGTRVAVTIVTLGGSLIAFPTTRFTNGIVIMPVKVPRRVFDRCAKTCALDPSRVHSGFPREGRGTGGNSFNGNLVVTKDCSVPKTTIVTSTTTMGDKTKLVGLTFPSGTCPTMASSYPRGVLLPLVAGGGNEVSSRGVGGVRSRLNGYSTILVNYKVNYSRSATTVTRAILGGSTIPMVVSTSNVGTLGSGVGIVGDYLSPMIVAPRPNRTTEVLNYAINRVRGSEGTTYGTVFRGANTIIILGNSHAVIATGKVSFCMGLANGPNVTATNSKSVLSNVVLSFVYRGVGPFSTTIYNMFMRKVTKSVMGDGCSVVNAAPAEVARRLPGVLESLRH